MAFGQNTNKKIDVKSMARKVSDIDRSEVKTSTLILGASGTGKSVSVTGGKFKKLDVYGNIIEVEIPNFPLPMVIVDIDQGSLDNIKTLDIDKQEQFLYFNPTGVDEIFEILNFVIEHNNNATEELEDLTKDDIYKTVFIDGVHHVWSSLKGNMSDIKAKQNNVNLIKAMSSGKLSSMDKVTPAGTEYLPASTVWIKFTELLRKVKKHSNIVCTAGIEINDWGKTVTTKFLGHKNQESDYDIWGTSEVKETYIQGMGYAKQYFFTANRVRGGISGIVIEDFCYDKLQELI